MSISHADYRKLYQLSGNRCAFPGCTKDLIEPRTPLDGSVSISEVAHIVARKADGPRGHDPLLVEHRDNFDNLILLCEEHHHIVDTQCQFYTVERLRQMKDDHIKRMRRATSHAVATRADEQPLVKEMLHSTVLPVTRLPRYVYGAPVRFREGDDKKVAELVIYPREQHIMCPFILREGNLYCFQNLQDSHGPFERLGIPAETVTRSFTQDWWHFEPRFPWFVALLNRCLNKLTGRRGLNLDKEHHRYYFEPLEEGQPRTEKYRPLNQSSSELNVVWQPLHKRSGTPRPYWYHRAASLRFHRVGTNHWCLSIRPELRVTRDGFDCIDSDRIGGRVSHKKSRTFNHGVLSEIQFWRDYLSDRRPRIVFPFEKGQHMIISTTLLHVAIDWPGMPDKYAKAFRNVAFEDDLFTAADRDRLDEEYSDYDDETEWLDGEETNEASFQERDESSSE